MPISRPQQRARHADGGAAQQEDAHHRALPRPQRAQHRDVARLVLHHHDQRRDDVERRHQDDQRQDQEHHVALDLDGGEEAVVALRPVDHAHRRAGQRRAHRAAISRTRSGSAVTASIWVAASGRRKNNCAASQRQEDEAGVGLVEADLEDRHHLVGADARDVADHRRLALRRDQFQPAADADAQPLRQPDPDGHRIVALEGIQRAGQDMVRHHVQPPQIGLPHARAPARRDRPRRARWSARPAPPPPASPRPPPAPRECARPAHRSRSAAPRRHRRQARR